MIDFADYLTWEPDELLKRLARLAAHIGTSRKELSFARATVEREKAEAIRASGEGTVTGRRQAAQVQSVAAVGQMIELEGMIAEAVEEQTFLRDLLAVRTGVRV